MTTSEPKSRVVLAITLHDHPSHVTKTGMADGIRRTLSFSSPPGLFL